MLVSIVIPHYGSDDLLAACVVALGEHTAATQYELIVHDNNSVNLGFAGGCNAGAGKATSDLLVMLNNDTTVHAGWLPPLLAGFDDPKVGIVGAKLLYPDGRVQHGGVELVEYPNGFLEARNVCDPVLADQRRFVSAVTGACLAIRRELFVSLGGFDEQFVNGYEDVSLCLAAREAGWRVLYEPASVVTHLESASGPARWTHVQQNIQRLQVLWRGRVETDRKVV